MRRPAILVAGAGVVGAALALRLAQRGARVVCVDRSPRAGSGTTAGGFATTTAYQCLPEPYFALNRAGIAEHATLAGELGGSAWWHRCATVAWTEHASFSGYLDQLAQWGCPVRRHDAETARDALGDAVAFPAGHPIAVLPDEGWADAVLLTERLLDEATRAGALVRLGIALSSVDTVGGRVAAAELADGHRIEVDAVVNAAGSAADEVAAMAGAGSLLGAPRRSLVAHLLVGGEPLPFILRAPGVSLRSDGPGRVVAYSDQIDRRLPDQAGTPDPELVKELLDRAQRVVPLLGTATVESAGVVEERRPRDELPSAGALSAVPGYYEAVTGAGVALAPLLGRLLADQVTTGAPAPALAAFSPDRFR
jgi:glycine/D-amino acid oxidase-like deaminating enzyme